MTTSVQLAVVRECNQAVQLDAAWHASVLQDASPADFKRRAQLSLCGGVGAEETLAGALIQSCCTSPREIRLPQAARLKPQPLLGAEETGLSRGARSKRGYPRGRASCDGTSINSDGATFHP